MTHNIEHAPNPRAITMWDFSWLERRWPGAGYEDWDLALDELVERGYNAVRIDAFPHLISADPNREWVLHEVWSIQTWGSPDINRVRVQPNLNLFLAKCRQRDIKVGLSSWFRDDLEHTRMRIQSAQQMGAVWIKTLESIAQAGLLDAIWYVDLCNEWPGDIWAPYFKNNPPHLTWGHWQTEASMTWMKTAAGLVREAFPLLPITFSFDNTDVEKYSSYPLPFLDLAEHHIWMVKENDGEFYREVKRRSQEAGRPVNGDPLFSNQVYKNLVAEYRGIYQEKPAYWQHLLIDKVGAVAHHAGAAGLPLITTECWGIVDYKDWPLLDWDWVKELCELGVTTAAATGQWVGIATSNFCGPQFAGMWRDIQWHRRLTGIIRSAPIASPMQEKLIVHRI